ncbi:5-hydroxytryptamine receptor 4-like [Saccostrea echinata]|uniref:5-hydroxytryptamine receptor 4-like n=1 Tax=Saccostrea echinata TaxID=191078 RepID=UPI002A7EB16F|nr:5-hydroxytryptamine receptor 4-like [Saccostrea echinata]
MYLDVMLLHLHNGTVLPDATVLCNGTQARGVLSGNAFRIPVIVILSSVLGLTIFGNVLVIKVVTKRHQYKQRTNLFVISLAVADLSVAIFVMSFSILHLCSDFDWLHHNTTYLMYWGLDVLFTTTSILHLTCMTVDRYVAVTKPFKYYQIMKKRRVSCLLFLCWFLPVLISFSLMMIKFNQISVRSENCRITPILRVNALGAIIASVASFYLPVIFMIFCNVKIFRFIKSRGRKLHELTSNYVKDVHREQQIQKEVKVARTIAILLGCFLMCWLPFFTVNILEPLFAYELHEGAWVVITWLGYINSTVNPYLYYLYSYSHYCLAEQTVPPSSSMGFLLLGSFSP